MIFLLKNIIKQPTHTTLLYHTILNNGIIILYHVMILIKIFSGWDLCKKLKYNKYKYNVQLNY